MSQAGFRQTQSLKQTQTLSPQMQQSLQVLQAAALELRTLVQQEMSENPVLEDETTDPSLEDQKLNEDDGDDNFDEEFSNLSKMDEEWREYMAQTRRSTPRSASDEERRQFMFDSIVRPVTLHEHLLEQLHTEESKPEVRELAHMLIGNLDDNGFLQTSIEDISLNQGIPIEGLRDALNLVQSFEPVGVGAQSLGECLAIQLRREGEQHSLEYRIVTNHLDDLARRRYPQIARRLAVTVEQVAEAATNIAQLDPKPGRGYESVPSTYITPDVQVEEDEAGEFQVVLNNEQIPRLRISNTYKDLMATRGDSADVRNYIKDRIRSGRTLIRSIQQRQDTIRRISEEIVSRQKEFLRKGRAHLKPMNMAQVADAVGVHETTVSRAIAGKYISTPQGVHEMKFFFTTGYETESGEQMSNTSVKDAIRDVVSEEDGHKPLSDAAIVKALGEQGITIARRTVAKYREELNILPSHMRKTY